MTAATAILLNEGAGSARSERVRRSVDLVRVLLRAELHVTATRDPDAVTAMLPRIATTSLIVWPSIILGKVW